MGKRTCKIHKTQYADILVCDCGYWNDLKFWQPSYQGVQFLKPNYCPNCGCKINYEIVEIDKDGAKIKQEEMK